MKYRVTLEVEANQMQSVGKFTHDCGICSWRAGDWVIDDPEYGPFAISDEEFRQRFTPVEVTVPKGAISLAEVKAIHDIPPFFFDPWTPIAEPESHEDWLARMDREANDAGGLDRP
jgi:hypothetical protein